MKKSLCLLLLSAVIFSMLISSACKSITSDEIKSSLEVTDIETKWVSKYYQPWPPRLILVPTISLRLKNIGSKPLNFISLNAIFKFKDEAKNMGDNFLVAIRSKPVMPGEKSDLITLKSNFGVEGKNLDSFKNTIDWKPTEVKIFAQSRGSQPALLGQWDVSRTIDFKAPEPVEIKKSEPAKAP